MPKSVKGVIGARACSSCGVEKRAERFYPSNPYECKKCLRQQLREHRRNNPHIWATYQRRSTLKRRYGMTPEQYEIKLAAQNHACEICKSPHVRRRGINNFAVDHDHITNQVRGLLCHNCNRGLGHFHDNAELLASAIAYLLSYQRVAVAEEKRA